MSRKHYQFLGIRVDNVRKTTVVSQAATAIAANEKLHIVTVNPELIMTARYLDEFRDCINTAGVVTPDGIGLVIMGRLTGRPLAERVTGVDLCEALAAEGAKHSWRIYLLGAGTGVAQRAGAHLALRNPGLVICGSSDADPDDADTILPDIKATKPDILLVAYGSPTQELWLRQHASKTGAKVTMGVGGSFDFIAGTAKRAPRFVQKIGLEWLWRLITQPWRWRRMLALPKFAILTLLERKSR